MYIILGNRQVQGFLSAQACLYIFREYAIFLFSIGITRQDSWRSAICLHTSDNNYSKTRLINRNLSLLKCNYDPCGKVWGLRME